MTNFSNISESPVQFTRRNLFKSAAAGAATMATAGLSVAQAAPKKEGTYANNGAPEALRIRNDRISDENKKTLMALPCKYVPVAVKFYAVKPENFGLKYKHTDKRMSLCQFVSYAQKTHSSFYIDKTNEDCMGRTVLGMVQEPPLGASGQAGFDFGVFRNQDANSRLYYNIPIAIRDTINYVIFSPIDQCEFNPDVVVFVGDSDMADIVMRATSYISGKARAPAFCPVPGPTCIPGCPARLTIARPACTTAWAAARSTRRVSISFPFPIRNSTKFASPCVRWIGSSSASVRTTRTRTNCAVVCATGMLCPSRSTKATASLCLKTRSKSNPSD